MSDKEEEGRFNHSKAIFRILRKCLNKFDCLIFEMFFIRALKPKLNKQSDSIRAKIFA